jgi:hypothetical protein
VGLVAFVGCVASGSNFEVGLLHDDVDAQFEETSEIVLKQIHPATTETRCRYVDLLHMAAHLGRVEVFVSHTWGARFPDTVAAIAHALPDSAFVWLDIFAVRQWPGNAADLPYRNIVRDTNSLLFVATHVPAVANMSMKDAFARKVPEKAMQVR